MTENEIVLSAALAVAFRMTLDIQIIFEEITAEMSISCTNKTLDELYEIITSRKVDIVTKASAMIKLFG